MIIFLVYTADVTLIAKKHGITFHSYADDSELHVHCKVNDTAVTLLRVLSISDDIDDWLTSNRLKLNTDIAFSSKQQIPKVNCNSIRLLAM